MPKNKNASYRYRLIDQLLSGGRIWSFETFLKRVGERLCEEFDVESEISERTLVTDIRIMRKDPPQGFAAPIVRKKKMIYYDDKNYSIHNLPLIPQDVKTIQEALLMLEQFKGLPHGGQLLTVIEKIKAYLPISLPSTSQNVIFVEQNPGLKGLEWISPLYRFITSHQKVEVRYQSFKRKVPKMVIFHPYLLKEFNNRWFVLGFNEAEGKRWLFALDRVEHLEPTHEYFQPVHIDGNAYFKDVIGVTVYEDREPQKITLWFAPQRAPYVLTKPLHHSQTIIKESPEEGITLHITVIPNNELISLLRSFGPDVKVLSPKSLLL